MRDTEPEVNERGHYPVCEAARRLGCERHTLWRYANHLNIQPRYNPINNRRFFTGHELLRIWRAAM